MQVQRSLWTAATGWEAIDPPGEAHPTQLVIYFAGPGVMEDGARFAEIRALHPAARIVGCTTGGEILGREVYDGAIALVALTFAHSSVRVAGERVAGRGDSFAAGAALARSLADGGPRGVFVLSDGTRVNGSELVRGLKDNLPANTILTGGLAGDGDAFVSTLVGTDTNPQPGTIIAVGFYGERLNIRHGSFGGWDPFGPQRLITRSDDNILYELDGEPALDLYKRYLGEEADRLPGSALLFPLCIKPTHDSLNEVVRTVVGIDESARAMIFAGDVPKGYTAQLMRGNFEHLIAGAGRAAEQAAGLGGDVMAILVSCIGRKLLLGQRVAEEVETVVDALRCPTIGFYSYGEICPQEFLHSCELHNQTMTITTIGEQ